MKTRSLIAALLLLASAAPLAAQPPAPPDAARALLDKVMRAQGGVQRLKGVYAYREKLRYQVLGEKGTEYYSWDLFIALPDRVHLEVVNAAGQKFTFVVTPSGAVGISGISGEVTQDMPSYWVANWMTSIRRTSFYVAQHLDDGSVRVSLAGSEPVAGTMAAVLEIGVGADVTRAWVDPQTGKPLRASATRQTDKGIVTQVVELSDLRSGDGILTAFHLVVSENGRQVGVRDTQAVEWNPPVDPRLFYRQPLMLDQVPFNPVATTPATFLLTGTVKVVSQPTGAQLYVDDVAKGTTSESEGRLIVEGIAPGSHRLRVAAAGYQEWTKTVNVEPGDAVEAAATLQRAGPLPFTENDVTQMLRGGVSPRRAAVLVGERGVDFALNNAAEQRLRAAGADDALLLAIAKAKK